MLSGCIAELVDIDYCCFIVCLFWYSKLCFRGCYAVLCYDFYISSCNGSDGVTYGSFEELGYIDITLLEFNVD